MTRKRNPTPLNRHQQATVGVLSHQECEPRTQHEIELEDRLQCALREVCEALLEASDPDEAECSMVNLKLASELTQ